MFQTLSRWLGIGTEDVTYTPSWQPLDLDRATPGTVVRRTDNGTQGVLSGTIGSAQGHRLARVVFCESHATWIAFVAPELLVAA